MRDRAEDLWETIGNCVCCQMDVGHWCEGCQRKLQTIREAFASDRAVHPEILGYRAPITATPYCLSCIQSHRPWTDWSSSAPVYDTHETCIQCGKSLRASDRAVKEPDRCKSCGCQKWEHEVSVVAQAWGMVGQSCVCGSCSGWAEVSSPARPDELVRLRQAMLNEAQMFREADGDSKRSDVAVAYAARIARLIEGAASSATPAGSENETP